MRKTILSALGVFLIPSFALALHSDIESELEIELQGIEHSLLGEIHELTEAISSIATSSGGSTSSVKIINVVNATSGSGGGEVQIEVKGSINGQEFDYKKKEILNSGGIHFEFATSSGDGRAQAKSIVIIGNDIRGNGTTTGLLRALSVTPSHVFDEEDFSILAGKLTAENEALAKVELEDTLLKIDSILPAKLFGFIPVIVRPRIEVAASSTPILRFPWWHIFVTTSFDTDQLEEEIENLQASTTSSLLTRQAALFETISRVLKNAHDIGMNSIRNLK